MVLHRGSDMNLKGSRRKKKGMVDNCNCKPWSELPEALLDLITKLLGVIDYLMFGCVCKGWRLYVAAHRKEFMASQPPLVVLLSSYARRTCYFYSIFDQKLYKAILPDLVGKRCSGVSCGYFVMEDKKKSADSQIWFLNPFTRHELRFSSPPNRYLSIILASLPTPLQEFVIIAIDVFFLQFRKSTDVNWTVYDCRDLFKDHFKDYSRWLLDGAVFKGKIYILTNHGEIGILNPNSYPYVTLLEVKGIGYKSSGLRLLAFEDKLLMIHRYDDRVWQKFQVYELNFLKMKWVKMQNLNDQALFLSNKSSGFSDMTRWRGSQQTMKYEGWSVSQRPKNCIYNLGAPVEEYSIHFLDDTYPESFPIIDIEDFMDLMEESLDVPLCCKISIRDASSGAQFWFFPNLCSSVDALYDD
ncbi:hypothetical protein RGQ29_012390 [Quercus rubra]|uniref:F-box protein n=1 Tax=Quercus rubra TaxID=3512 RepID=A0AAN7G3U2_QUERU|nr:hypothetical protein RGQ29_012390 [Quercus rubra]